MSIVPHRPVSVTPAQPACGRPMPGVSTLPGFNLARDLKRNVQGGLRLVAADPGCFPFADALDECSLIWQRNLELKIHQTQEVDVY